MHPQNIRHGQWISLPEASRILQRPETTLRNMIKAGQLQAERLPRNPDNPADTRTILRILLPEPPGEDAASESEHPQASATEPPVATTRLLDTVLAQAETIATLRERVGRAEASLEAANARAEQHALDYGEQFERAVRAEQRVRDLERRRWWWPW